MENKYDSTADTLIHIRQVQENLNKFAIALIKRGQIHDNSKLESPEKEMFDETTQRLKTAEYGSEEYKGFLKELKPALDHHYTNNSHHPEHYSNGIDGMSLQDLVEMYCDWKAAVKRTKDGDLLKSIEINSTRFNMSEQLVSIFKNTYNRESHKQNQ